MFEHASGTLFTIFLEYRGETYVTQVLANGPVDALKNWECELTDHMLRKWGLKRAELKAAVQSSEPTKVKDCQAVWCTTCATKNGLILIDIVGTQQEA